MEHHNLIRVYNPRAGKSVLAFEDLCELAKTHTLAQLTRIDGRSRAAVRTLLGRRGITCKRLKNYGPLKFGDYPSAVILALADKFSAEQLAEWCARPYKDVYDFLVSHGKKPKIRPRKTDNLGRRSKKELAALASTHTARQISEIDGRAEAYIKSILKSFGVQAMPVPRKISERYGKCGNLDTETIRELCKTNTRKQISDLAGVNYGTIRTYLQNHSLSAVLEPLRKPGKLSESEICHMASYRTLSEISALDGTSTASIKGLLDRSGITCYQKPQFLFSRYCDMSGMHDQTFLRLATKVSLGGRCSRCRLTDINFLQINHINGENVPSTKGPSRDRSKLTSQFRDAILGNSNFLNVLCSNCNFIHEYERGRLPEIPEHRIYETMLQHFLDTPRRKQFRRSDGLGLDYGITRHQYYRLRANFVLGGCCSVCRISDPRVLHINHLYQWEVDRSSKTATNRRVPQSTEKLRDLAFSKGQVFTNLDLRCANCNWLYEITQGRVKPIYGEQVRLAREFVQKARENPEFAF